MNCMLREPLLQPLPKVPNSSPNSIDCDDKSSSFSWNYTFNYKKSVKTEKRFIDSKLNIFNINKPDDEIELFVLNRWQKLINEKHGRKELIRCLNDLKRNRVPEAKKRCEKLLKRSIELGLTDQMRLLSLSLLSKCNYQLDNPEEALENQQEFLRSVEEFNDYQELVRMESLEEIGKILVKLGRLGEAVSILEYRLSLTPPPAQKRIIWLRNLLSICLFETNKEKSKYYAEENLKESEKLGGLWIGICSAISGFAEVNCGNLQIGIEYLNKALDLWQVEGSIKRINEIKQEIFRVNDLIVKDLKSKNSTTN
ncbi:DgyrCDS7969 [Dimorphilus gyrociliatus]|uniref:DgyrCDS7969 n=1 Tax=Dimorphilus gyrociliatus TaxID=2664684 RepID=A0A7I8VST1_9ANNE|nr:DgyrCDS7969 [Dimorphilus gyrociliatus]